jgi:hypothetical protein
LAISCVVDDPARNRHGRDSAWRDNIDNHIGADGGLNGGEDKTPANADFAKFGAHSFGFVTDSHTDGQPNWNSRVLALARFGALAHQRLQDEIALGGFIRCESDESPRSDAKPG